MLAAHEDDADLVSRILAAAPAARRCCDALAEPALAAAPTARCGDDDQYGVPAAPQV